jgi:hypothetical protein
MHIHIFHAQRAVTVNPVHVVMKSDLPNSSVEITNADMHGARACAEQRGRRVSVEERREESSSAASSDQDQKGRRTVNFKNGLRTLNFSGAVRNFRYILCLRCAPSDTHGGAKIF